MFSKKSKEASAAKRISSSRKEYSKVPTKSVLSDSSRSPSPSKRSTTSRRGSGNSSESISCLEELSESDSDIDERTLAEKELFKLVDLGDPEMVQTYLKQNKTIDLDKLDVEGYSVLHKAVKNDNAEVVDILLSTDKGIDIDQALLDAVKENSMEMVQKLLNYLDTANSRKTTLRKLYPQQRKSSLDSSQYGEEMTPLMMAAIHGHYELIELLYSRGHRLEELHMPQCNCSLCAGQSSGLNRSNARINLLRAMGSPEYVAFMAGEDKHYDPIHRVFVLTHEIKMCMKQEPEFLEQYKEVLDSVKDFPVKMLGMCRNAEEARTFLRNKSGFKGSSAEFPYPRLLVAIDMNQKEFIAHPHCQDILKDEWEGEQWPTETLADKSFKFLTYCLIVILYPVISFLLWVTFCCTERMRAVRWIVRPKNRFMVYCFNYLVFMAILLFVSATEKGDVDLGPPHFYVPWVIVFFETSHIISFVTHFTQHPIYFIKKGWNLFELVNHIFWLITFFLWGYLWKVESRGNHFFSRTKVRHEAVPREALDPDDLTLLTEVSFGVASCMTGLRFLKVFVINKSTGAMLSALGSMSNDLLKFVVFFGVINISFSLGVHHLYRPYVILSPEHTYILGDFYKAIENFFWAMFTMSDASAANLVPVIVQEKPKIENKHYLTESVGKIIYCAYHMLGVTFLMNMLTGLMSNRYGRITDNVDVEWKFARSELWLHFIKDSVIAPPFNILPNGLALCNFFGWVRVLTCTRNPTQLAGCSLTRCCYVEAIETEQERKDREHAYPKLIRQLLQRYFRSKMSTKSEDAPTKERVTEVRNRVIELRAMTELLKNQ